jgi:hypothetical protein
MLLHFAVENYLSFRDRAVLSMLADPRVAHEPGPVLEGAGRQARAARGRRVRGQRIGEIVLHSAGGGR